MHSKPHTLLPGLSEPGLSHESSQPSALSPQPSCLLELDFQNFPSVLGPFHAVMSLNLCLTSTLRAAVSSDTCTSTSLACRYDDDGRTTTG